MSFYFVWLKADETFDATHHARQDETMLHFHIDHEQGAVPLLFLTVPLASHKRRQKGQRGVLWQKEGDTVHLLFDGILVGNPAEKKEDFLLLILEAGRKDKKAQMEKILAVQKQQCFEPLLVAPDEQDDSEEILEAGSVLPQWDRVTGQLMLVNIDDKGETVEVGGQFFADSLEMHQTGRLLSKIRCAVTAEWVQRYDGVLELGPLIQRAGERGYLSTLTPHAVQQRWWKKDYPLQRTGYEILESNLTAVTPPSTGGLNLYPLKSASFTVEGAPRTVPHVWFVPSLKVQWHYRQKRKETVHLDIPYAETGEVLDLTMRLQNICSPIALPAWAPNHVYPLHRLVQHAGIVYRSTMVHRSGPVFEPPYWEKYATWPTAMEDPSQWSFFKTARGTQVISHVVERLYAYGLFLGPRLEIHCRLPFVVGRQLRGHEQVRLVDPRLPEGTVIAEVITYRLIAEGDTGERWAEVTAVVRTNAKTGGALTPLQEVKKAEGILDPRLIQAEDLVQRIFLKDAAQAQNATLQGKKFPTLQAAHRFLATMPTRLRVELKDLKRTEELSHVWQVQLRPGIQPSQ